jgi:hypothetical protein
MIEMIERSAHSTQGALVAAAVALASCAFAPEATAASEPTAFVVGNYPVDAQADNAVAAKEKAIAEGQQRAFRSLVKRLTPVTAQRALARLEGIKAADLVDGIQVRAERNSSTSYTASLDFSFDARRVRDLLIERGIPFVDQQAPETAIVLVYLPPQTGATGQLSAEGGARMWREVWSGLDLEHALTPVKVHAPPAALTGSVVKAAMGDPNAPLRAIATLSRSGQALLAIAEPDPAAKRLHVTLSGTDAVGSFVLKRSWRMNLADPLYAAEYAAVVALGTIEGRWKAVKGGAAPPMPSAGAGFEPIQLAIEFASMQEWQDVSQRISRLPGVSDYVVAGLSGRSATVALRYPGGGGALASALATQGVDMRPVNGAWLVRALR